MQSIFVEGESDAKVSVLRCEPDRYVRALVIVFVCLGRHCTDCIADRSHITPLAAPGSLFQSLNPGIASAPDFLVGQAQTTSMSPDGKTLIVLTSGYNLSENKDTTGEWVFVFDISAGQPNQLQALKIPNAFCGLVWAPDGSAFSVAGGQDDNVHIFAKKGGQWVESSSPIPLNHTAYGVPQPSGNGLFSLPGRGAALGPLAAGLGVDGRQALPGGPLGCRSHGESCGIAEGRGLWSSRREPRYHGRDKFHRLISAFSPFVKAARG